MLLRASAIGVRVCVLALVLAVLRSFAHVTWVPSWLQIVITLIPGMLTLWRPLEGLQLVAALAPVAVATGLRFGAPPLPLAEALVLSALAGALARSLWRPLVPPRATRAALWLFGLTVIASLVVELAAMQIRTAEPGPFVRSLAEWTTQRYFVERKPAVTAAALLLEGLGLFWMSSSVCRGRGGAATRLLRMVVIGASAAALLNVCRVAIAVLSKPAHMETLTGILRNARLNIHFGDVNAAGSQFALVLCIAMGLALTRSRTRPLWIACTATLAAGMWLAGSRAAFVAIAIALLAAAAWRLAPRWRTTGRRTARVVLVLGLAGVVVVLSSPRMRFNGDLRRSASFRVDVARTSLRMARENPLFGVGVGRFYSEYPRFSSPALLALYRNENAHNNFLQVLAELGAVGLAAFLLLLYRAAATWRRAAAGAGSGGDGEASTPDMSAERLGVVAGLMAFAITMLVGHPLLVPEVAFTFWLVLGVWSATAAPVSEPVTTPLDRPWLVSAMTAAIVLSLVIRVPAVRKAVDLEHVDYGFSAAVRGPGGDSYRRVERDATFFAPSDPRLTNAVELPLMADGDPAVVELSFDGRPADRQRIEGRWRTIRLRVPPGSHAFRRVDIRTNVPVRIGKIKFTHAVAGEVAVVDPPRRPIVPADFDGDGRSDVVIFRPRTGAWHIKLSSVGFAAGAGAQWGQPGDIPVVGDYDGDGHADTAVFRPQSGDWLIQPWQGGQADRIVQMWGLPGDIPVPADYDGDGRTDLAVFRPREGVWYLRLSRNGLVERREWGVDGDLPVPGDYDGDGRADAAVYRPTERRWHLNLSAGNQVVQWDADAGYAMSGDFDGDGIDDLAGWQPASGHWRIRAHSGEVRTVTFGKTGDVPVPGRYRTSERVDIAVFRPRTGKWFVPDLRTIDFGQRGDLPVLAAKGRSVASMTAGAARIARRLQ